MTKKDMQQMIEQLSRDSVFGCYTRQALEIQYSKIYKKFN